MDIDEQKKAMKIFGEELGNQNPEIFNGIKDGLSWANNYYWGDKDIMELNNRIINACLKRYGISRNSLKKLISHQNIVYSYTKDNKEYILRVTNSKRRNLKFIYGELDWISFLSDNKVSVSSAIESLNGKLIEVVTVDGNDFFITAFKKAYGIYAKKQFRNKELFKNMGRLTGEMHNLSKQCNLNKKYFYRPQWYNSNLLNYINMTVDKSETLIYKEFYNTLNELNQLPKNYSSYGIIHSDIHFKNFNVSDNAITYFDFDDCEYGWFVNDISVQLFYFYVENYDSNEKEKDARCFIKGFLEGYNKENQIDNYWITKLPLFLKLREIIMYSMLYNWKTFDSCSPWVKNYMIYRKECIENKKPLIDLDFSKLCHGI